MGSDFFASNQNKLTSLFGNVPIVLSANSLMQKRGDMAYSFSQESNFWWLTGINEPDWILIINGDNKYLVAPDIDDSRRIFDGDHDVNSIKATSGIDNVIDKAEGDRIIKELSAKHNKVCTLGADPRRKYYDFHDNPGPKTLSRRLTRLFAEVKDCRPELARLRAIKTKDEIELMQTAIDLSVDAFQEIRKNINSYDHEYQIEADFSRHFRFNGADGHAYEPIIASGINACTLHYSKNNSSIKSGELVLIDVGASRNGYNADITRTYSVGKASARQISVHNAVQKAHYKIIDLLKPGLSFEDYHKKSDEIMRSALEDLGLLNSESDYRKYFPHAISHGLGIDVHESLGGYGDFKPGMTLTVEPGIYMPDESIGVRIEDNILITDSGYINMSAKLSTDLL